MEDLYLKLDIDYNADYDTILEQSKINLHKKSIGNDDQENVRDFLNLKESFHTLLNKGSRFLYDLTIGVAKEKRCSIYFNNQDEINDFVEIVEKELVKVWKQNSDYSNQVQKLNIELKELSEKNAKVNTFLEAERNKNAKLVEDTKEAKSHISKVVDNAKKIKSELLNNKEQIKENQKEISELKAKVEIIEKQNEKLKNILHNIDIRIFKRIAIATGIFIFILVFIVLKFVW